MLMMILSSLVIVTSAVHANVVNNLGDGKNMSLHCQSKDDDLGMVEILDGNEFKWDFSINFCNHAFILLNLVGKRLRVLVRCIRCREGLQKCYNICLYNVHDDRIYTMYAPKYLYYTWQNIVTSKLLYLALFMYMVYL